MTLPPRRTMVPKSLLLASLLALPAMSRPLSPLIYDGGESPTHNDAPGDEAAGPAPNRL